MRPNQAWLGWSVVKRAPMPAALSALIGVFATFRHFTSTFLSHSYGVLLVSLNWIFKPHGTIWIISMYHPWLWPHVSLKLSRLKVFTARSWPMCTEVQLAISGFRVKSHFSRSRCIGKSWSFIPSPRTFSIIPLVTYCLECHTMQIFLRKPTDFYYRPTSHGCIVTRE